MKLSVWMVLTNHVNVIELDCAVCTQLARKLRVASRYRCGTVVKGKKCVSLRGCSTGCRFDNCVPCGGKLGNSEHFDHELIRHSILKVSNVFLLFMAKQAFIKLTPKIFQFHNRDSAVTKSRWLWRHVDDKFSGRFTWTDYL